MTGPYTALFIFWKDPLSSEQIKDKAEPRRSYFFGSEAGYYMSDEVNMSEEYYDEEDDDLTLKEEKENFRSQS